jgi:hypothetical protein
MELCASVENIHNNFNQLLKMNNAYGDIHENKLVYIKNGHVYKILILTPSYEPFSIRQIYGERTFGMQIIHSINKEEFNGLVPNNFAPPQMEENIVPTAKEMHDSLKTNILSMKSNITSKYGTDYINIISSLLTAYKDVESFSDIFHSYFKDEIKDWLVLSLKQYMTCDWMTTIPLLELLDKVMVYDKSIEYFDILRTMMSQEYTEDRIMRYIKIISEDIYTKYS